MSDKPETLAAILAKYRKDIAGGQFFTPTQEYILRLLDRIEAAAKRERDDLVDAHDAIARLEAELAEVRRERDALAAERAPGNAAAMREALERSTRRLRGVVRELPLEMQKYVNADIRDNDAALAAPARNCDRFATVGAAHKAWRATDQERDFADWLFDKAEEVN